MRVALLGQKVDQLGKTLVQQLDQIQQKRYDLRGVRSDSVK